jgi:PAS domain S-box-containing protein
MKNKINFKFIFKLITLLVILVLAVLIVNNLSSKIEVIKEFVLNNKLIITELLLLIFVAFLFFEKRHKVIEDKYRNLFNYSQDAIFLLNTQDFKFSDGNLATLKLFGLKDLKELKKMNIESLSPQYQPDGKFSSEKAKEMINVVIENNSGFFHWVYKKVNGSEFLTTIYFNKIKIDGRIFFQALVRDVTEEYKLIETMKKSQEKLEKALKESEHQNKLMIGRELEMIELKKEIASLKH